MAEPLTMTRVECLPSGLERLVDESEVEGFAFMRRLLEDWASGQNRFDGPGEALYEAREPAPSRRLVGICGLNRDPFAGDPSVGRLRHLFVTPGRRRAGVGRRLVQHVVAHATGGPFAVIRLRTDTAVADSFYLAMGFERAAAAAHATHVRRLR